jgi:hypothetical protein
MNTKHIEYTRINNLAICTQAVARQATEAGEFETAHILMNEYLKLANKAFAILSAELNERVGA